MRGRDRRRALSIDQAPRRGRPTREEAVALDDRLHEAALGAFVANGFDGTTMEAVAAAAGISKRTLYAKFPDKRTLFATVVPRALARSALDDVELDLPADDLEAALRALARHVVARLVAPSAVRLRRLAVLEGHRFPEFAEAGNVDLWRQSVHQVIDLLRTHAEAGRVVVEDLEVTADQFIAMVAGLSMILSDYGVLLPPEDEAQRIDHAVRLLLTGIRPR